MIQLNPAKLFLILNNRLHRSRILWEFILYLLKLLLHSIKNDVTALSSYIFSFRISRF